MNRTDNFNRTDTALALGTPSDAGSDWVAQSGTWGITTNRGYMSASGTPQATAVLESSVANVDIQAVFQTVGDDGGLCARATDDSNYIVGTVSTTTMRVFKREAGGFTQLGSTFTGTISNGDTLKLSVDGSNIVFYQNGVARVTTASSFNASATKHGLRSNDTDVTRFDDFAITAIAPPAGGFRSRIAGGLVVTAP